jgi:hypothetical protein
MLLLVLVLVLREIRVLRKTAFTVVLLTVALHLNGHSCLASGLLLLGAEDTVAAEPPGPELYAAWRDSTGLELRLAQGQIDPNKPGGARLSPLPAEKQRSTETSSTFRVIDVATNDVLNIRSGPNAKFSIVSTIPPNARGIRITGACTGQWCPVQFGLAHGWANRSFLAIE